MRPFRNVKIASVIEHELGTILTRDLDTHDSFVTITDVVVDEELLLAHVKVGIIPYERGPEVFLELEQNRSHFQHLLLKKMNIRPMPQIRFSIEEPK